MAVEKITLNLIPTGETPTIHAAQFDKERAFQIELKEGEDDFSPTGYTIELQVRKVDNNIVTAIPSQVSGNIVTFLTSEQMTACSGTNLAELQISKNNMSIATLHFYLVVQRDVLAGGLSSQSEIYDLEEQIAAIVPEVIGDEYYTADQVDEKIAEIPTFDPTNYYDKTQLYTKTETNGLLSQKVNTSSLSTVAFTGSYDDLSDKPTIPGNASVLPISASDSTNTKDYIDSGLSGKADKSELYNVYPTEQESGSLVHITDGADNIPVKSLVSQIVAVETGSGKKSPDNPYTISGFSQGVITVTDNAQVTNTYTFAFGQTVYGGHLNVTTGKLTITHGYKTYNGSEKWSRHPSDPTAWFYIVETDFKNLTTDILSNMFTYNTGRWNVNNSIWIIYNQIHIRPDSTVSPSGQTDAGLAEFKAYLALHPLEVCVELATPITYQLTPTEVKTLLGENNIFSNCGDVEVNYYADIGLYIDKKISSLAQA